MRPQFGAIPAARMWDHGDHPSSPSLARGDNDRNLSEKTVASSLRHLVFLLFPIFFRAPSKNAALSRSRLTRFSCESVKRMPPVR